MNTTIKSVSYLMKELVYKKDAILLVFIFPIFCLYTAGFLIGDFILDKVYGVE